MVPVHNNNPCNNEGVSMSKSRMIISALVLLGGASASAPPVLHQVANAGTCYYLKKYTAPDGGTVCANDGNQCMACIPYAK